MKDNLQSSLDSLRQQLEDANEQAEEETARLKETRQSAIRLQQQKAIQQISQQIVLLSLKQVRDQLKLKMKLKTFHPWVNKVKINKYTSIKKYSFN